MTPFSKKFQKPYAYTLLRIAEGDLNTAAAIAKQSGVRHENTCFLVQQAVEKALKAVLCWSELPVPMTHDVGALLGMLPASLPPPAESARLVALTEFASVRRYEEGHYELTAKEIEAAIAAGKEVIAWAKAAII